MTFEGYGRPYSFQCVGLSLSVSNWHYAASIIGNYRSQFVAGQTAIVLHKNVTPRGYISLIV